MLGLQPLCLGTRLSAALPHRLYADSEIAEEDLNPAEGQGKPATIQAVPLNWGGSLSVSVSFEAQVFLLENGSGLSVGRCVVGGADVNCLDDRHGLGQSRRLGKRAPKDVPDQCEMLMTRGNQGGWNLHNPANRKLLQSAKNLQSPP